MKILRKHIAAAWQIYNVTMSQAEQGGLTFITGKSGGEKLYDLADVLEHYAALFPEVKKRKMNMDDITRLIRIVSLDANHMEAGENQFTVHGALEILENGGIPHYPDATTAHKISIAFKNHVDARRKALDHMQANGEVVAKTLFMEKVNEIANLYEDKFGDSLFREMERRQNEIAASILANNFYACIRDIIGQKHDDVITEVNHIEERIQAGI